VSTNSTEAHSIQQSYRQINIIEINISTLECYLWTCVVRFHKVSQRIIKEMNLSEKAREREKDKDIREKRRKRVADK